MAQKTSGIKSILSSAFVYNFLQYILGVSVKEKHFFRQYIKAKKNESILDIGCGTANIVNSISSDVVYTGFDISTKYINFAKNKYKDRNNIYLKDELASTKSLKDQTFDYIILNKLLHHLDDNEVLNLFKLCKNHLNNNGKIITLDPCFVNKQKIISYWIVNNDRGQNVRTIQGYQDIALKVFNNVKGEQFNGSAWLHIDTYVMELKNNE